MLPILGLDDPGPALPPGHRQPCPKCGNPLPDPHVNGGFKRCRRVKCQEPK